jgi:hypothetical protein
MDFIKLVGNSVRILQLILTLIMASILITIPFLVLNYFFSLEVAYFAFLMVGFIPFVYSFVKQKTGLNR